MASSQRQPFLDNLRILALGLLIVYHVGMYYVGWEWHVKSAHRVEAIEPVMRLLEPWRMSLLFLISGAVTGLALQRAAPGWLGARMRRLGFPLLMGMLVIVPPQTWWQVREQLGYGGSYVSFLGLYYTGYRGFCDTQGQCLAIPTWNHLWFLPYLMAYTLALWFVLRRWPALPQRIGNWLAPRLGMTALLWAPLVLLLTLRLALRPWFEVTHNLTRDPLAHAMYLPVFVVGALWACTPGAWAAVARLRWLAVFLWLGAWAMSVGWGEASPGPIVRTAYAMQQWCGVLAAVGLGYRWLQAAGPVQRQLSGLVFPVYVLHQTLIIALAMALRPLEWPTSLEASVLVLSTLGLSVALALAVRQVPWLAPWLGWSKT